MTKWPTDHTYRHISGLVMWAAIIPIHILVISRWKREEVIPHSYQFVFIPMYNFFSPGYHDADNDVTKNTITFEVALTMLNHTYNDTSPYTVGFTIWKRDQDSVEIMWSAQQSVQAEDTSLPELVR